MNWLAWDRRAYLGTAIGAVVGFLLLGVLAHQGWNAPWVVGVSMGLGCAALTQEKSSLRG